MYIRVHKAAAPMGGSGQNHALDILTNAYDWVLEETRARAAPIRNVFVSRNISSHHAICCDFIAAANQ